MSGFTSANQLESTVVAARTWLHGLDEGVVRHRPSPDRWTISEVVGHMIDSACNHHQRLVRAQDSDELTFPKYDQNSWVAKAGYDKSDWAQLVDLWHLYNLHLAQVIRNVSEDDLDTPCTITPHETCTLGFLVSDYVNHLNHHLAKIRQRTT